MSENVEQVGLVEAEVTSEEGETEESVWSIPQNLSLEKFDLLVKSCFQAKADKQPVDSGAIASISDIDARTALPNLRFLVHIGVLKGEGADDKLFSFTAKGAEYAQHVSSNENAEAGAILKELLESSHLEPLLRYIEVRKGSNDLTYEALFVKIRTLARVRQNEQGEISGRMKSGIRCLISLLARAGYVPASLLQQQAETRPTGSAIRRTAAPRQSSQKREAATVAQQETQSQMKFASPPFNVNIVIEAKDAEAIRQVIQLVRALRQESESDQTE